MTQVEEEKKYIGRGGWRGGGRPKKAEGRKVFKTVSISGSPEQIEQLKQLAEQNGKSVSRYVLDNLLK